MGRGGRLDNTRLDAKLGDLSPTKTITVAKQATLGQVLADKTSNNSKSK